jgi:5-(carboxyamino)imidazole ribonucleotide mutase
MSNPRVAVVMGSDSDWSVMHDAAVALAEFGVEVEVEVLSAHRTPDKMINFGRSAAARGIGVIIAGAGGAAHLPGMIAAVTTLPVIGVPVPLARLDGLDSLLSIVQMPAGVPVATVSIGGARNAGLLAVRILSVADAALATQLAEFATSLESLVETKNATLKANYAAELNGSDGSGAQGGAGDGGAGDRVAGADRAAQGGTASGSTRTESVTS